MTKLLLIAIALAETGTGVALLVAPSSVVELLLGEGLSSPQATVLGRITGAALISIGVICWRVSFGEPHGRHGLVRSTLFYNLAVPALLVRAGIVEGIRGIAIWPACALHIGLAIWCALSLQRD